ncbi:hypothetical protein [Winogradskyella haliclonae]|uniref:Fibronectin type-III domain-containing protein n=1 Tax=Winogradskyella haliclonae TaxID=2048558 RepID=A0ABQ2C0W1_9FLAO|nr:hypothetical protein [Winogradskyella haliclonae]GGI58109.1 hypothetical protein GCM10011444_24180 [Winogradskyella haliclonae]
MKRLIKLTCFVLLVQGCVDTTDDNINTLIPNGEIPDDVEGVQLIFPFESSLCTEGTNITPTESTVLFEWEPNNNAQSYILTVENLSTNSITEYETEDFIYPVTIQRAVSYRWFVNYAFNDEILESETWNFYNAGEAIQTYPPFQAEIISPTIAQTLPSTNSVTLQWSGSDVDDDIVDYDVYLSTINPPELATSNISASQLTVAVVSGNIYYWRVVTRDAAGNTSESDIFQFNIQ